MPSTKRTKTTGRGSDRRTSRTKTRAKRTKTAARRTKSTAKRPAPKRANWETVPNPYFVLRQSAIQGRGAFATRPIRKGTRIIEYVGEVITPAEADNRYDDGGMGRHHTFLFSVDRRKVIDAGVDGNDARFINHSCAPNCEAVEVNRRIFIEALRTIAPGEELTYDYAYERDGTEDETWEQHYVCRCGAEACRGTILAPKKGTRRGTPGK